MGVRGCTLSRWKHICCLSWTRMEEISEEGNLPLIYRFITHFWSPYRASIVYFSLWNKKGREKKWRNKKSMVSAMGVRGCTLPRCKYVWSFLSWTRNEERHNSGTKSRWCRRWHSEGAPSQDVSVCCLSWTRMEERSCGCQFMTHISIRHSFLKSI